MFDQNEIKSKLSNLAFSKQIVFASSCCERLLPFYFAFSKIENWGNPLFFREILDKLWKIVETEEFSTEELSELSQECYLLIPDSEDFKSPYTSLAQNASSAIFYSLEFCLKKDISLLGFLAYESFASVDMYLNIVNDPILEVHTADPELDAWIENAPMMKAEVEKQYNDIKILSLTGELTKTIIQNIRDSSARSSINPEKRGLL